MNNIFSNHIYSTDVALVAGITPWVMNHNEDSISIERSTLVISNHRHVANTL